MPNETIALLQQAEALNIYCRGKVVHIAQARDREES